MRFTNLMEDTKGVCGCVYEHGFSIYLKTEKYNYLLDFGASKATLKNAATLGVDLLSVEIGVLSHGHYDHAGGLLAFADMNREAKIYIQKSALEEHFRQVGDGMKNIGIAKEIGDLPNVCLLDGNVDMGEDFSLFTHIPGRRMVARGNQSLKSKKNGVYVNDDFSHEQCAVIREQGKTLLFSGCAHTGILNILDEYQRLYKSLPDVVVSGFHMVQKDEYRKEDFQLFAEIAKELVKTGCMFYTGHCTGEVACKVMKQMMGKQLQVLHCGESVELKEL